MDVTVVGAGVVGAGVVGLTVAHCLEQAGHVVRVVADRFGDRATSGVAGVLWFPYLARPPERVGAWAKSTTYRWLAGVRRSHQ